MAGSELLSVIPLRDESLEQNPASIVASVTGWPRVLVLAAESLTANAAALAYGSGTVRRYLK
jgi:hypothetical protein